MLQKVFAVSWEICVWVKAITHPLGDHRPGVV